MTKEKSFLAFDLGAGSVRAVRGILRGNRLRTEELHRAPNKVLELNGHFFWNIFGFYEEILSALSKVNEEEVPVSVGIDTWGLDFGFLSKKGNLMGLPYTYRDPWYLGAMEEFFLKIKREEIYQLTGIQFLPFNSLYQLSTIADREPEILDTAEDLLFIPDILNYFLSGIKSTEFSFATTSQLYNPLTASWEPELLERSGVNPKLMQPVVQPGTVLGPMAELEKVNRPGFKGLESSRLVSVVSHDTGSAVVAVPAEDKNFAYISSGTWSLMGIEAEEPILTEESMKMDITNEGGYDGTYRVLKNITGFWLLEGVLKSFFFQKKYSYRKLLEEAGGVEAFRTFIDPDDPSFINPSDMRRAITEYALETGQPVPGFPAEFTRIILESLALKYRYTLEQLRKISSRPINRIHVIGGGAKNFLLNQMTADATGLEVHAGPAEATSIGNLLVQAAAFGYVDGISGIRDVVRNSFEPEVYRPKGEVDWEKAYRRFKEILRLPDFS